jgi:ABC transporter substrate binding protein
MRRREFITLLGGAAAWPLAARGQHAERVQRIGVLLNVTADNPYFQTWAGAFLQGLQQSGWSIGQNMRIDTRWAGGSATEVRKHAAELAATAPDVILAHGDTTVGPLLQATRTVPIVFPVAADPVGAGFVDSLARPGGNATGFVSFEYSLSGKWLELLTQIAPNVTRAAVLRDPSQGSGTSQRGDCPSRRERYRVRPRQRSGLGPPIHSTSSGRGRFRTLRAASPNSLSAEPLSQQLLSDRSTLYQDEPSGGSRKLAGTVTYGGSPHCSQPCIRRSNQSTRVLWDASRA